MVNCLVISVIEDIIGHLLKSMEMQKIGMVRHDPTQCRSIINMVKNITGIIIRR